MNATTNKCFHSGGAIQSQCWFATSDYRCPFQGCFHSFMINWSSSVQICSSRLRLSEKLCLILIDSAFLKSLFFIYKPHHCCDWPHPNFFRNLLSAWNSVIVAKIWRKKHFEDQKYFGLKNQGKCWKFFFFFSNLSFPCCSNLFWLYRAVDYKEFRLLFCCCVMVFWWYFDWYLMHLSAPCFL